MADWKPIGTSLAAATFIRSCFCSPMDFTAPVKRRIGVNAIDSTVVNPPSIKRAMSLLDNPAPPADSGARSRSMVNGPVAARSVETGSCTGVLHAVDPDDTRLRLLDNVAPSVWVSAISNTSDIKPDMCFFDNTRHESESFNEQSIQ